LDDGAWASKSVGQWWAHAKLVIDTLQRCGFWLGLDKCMLRPVHVIELIGFVINSDKMTVTLPEKRVQKVQTLAHELREAGKVTVQQVRSMCGQIIACDLVCWGCRVFLRELYGAVSKFAELSPAKANLQFFHLTHEQKWELQFWEKQIARAIRPILYKVTAVELWSDASDWGYGGYWKGKQFAGLFNMWEHLQSSTFRELQGFEYLWHILKQGVWVHIANNPARMDFPAVLPVVRVYVDNQAMTFVMRWGSRKKIINQIAKRLWEEALVCGFLWHFVWIPRLWNVLADRMSKLLLGECVLNITAWKLCQVQHPDCQPTAQVFMNKWGTVPGIPQWWDMFHPLGKPVDFFIHQWSDSELPLLVPSHRLIGQILSRLQVLKRRAVMVCPNFNRPPAPWFPVLRSMCKWVWHPPTGVPMFIWLGVNPPIFRPVKLKCTHFIAYLDPR